MNSDNFDEKPNEVKEIQTEGGFSKDEAECMFYLFKTFHTYRKLPVQHPCEQSDFADAIHILQHLLGVRVLRKDYPEFWSTIEATNKESKISKKLNDIEKSLGSLQDQVDRNSHFRGRNQKY